MGKAFIAALAAFVCFVFYAGFLSGSGVDFVVAMVFSAVPLAAGFLGLVDALRKKQTDAFGAVNVLSLFAFNTLMIAYLAIVVLIT